MTYKDISTEKLVIVDIETLKSLFLVCCQDYKSGAKKEFIIFDDPKYADQPLALFNFLKNCVRNNFCTVTFNGLNFDQQILHFYYDFCCQKQDPLYQFDNAYIIDVLYKKAQELIGLQNSEDRFAGLVSERDLFLPTIDVFRQMHYDREAKRTSLKWVSFSMNYHTIQEMPIEHNALIEASDIPTVVEYCWNDVDVTYEFFKKIVHETTVRLDLSHQFKINLVNASEPKMVRDIFATFITKEMDITYQELKKLKTIRKDIAFKDIIFPYVKFQTKEFNNVLDVFCAKTLDANPHSKDTFKHTFIFQGLDVDLGLGGIHSSIKSGIYTETEEDIIQDSDGTSFYPMLAIKNGLRPAHLGEAFNKVYPMMFEERQKYDKKDPRNYIFKIILNSAYGLSKEINGYLYDPQFTYAVTINGQLSLLMLVEALYMSVPEIQFLQMNTDGITYKYNKKYKPIVDKICAWWQNTTKINLEHAFYSKMVIMDVNNYLAIYTDGKAKKKGLFETEMPFHKNPSSLVIPKALEQYFINNLPPKDFINDRARNIFDFCNGVKKKSNFKINLIRNYNHAELIEEQQKVCRYIISKHPDLSGRLVKDFEDGRRIAIEAKNAVIPLNSINLKDLEATKYPVDFDSYTKSTQKIIDIIQPPITQQTLF